MFAQETKEEQIARHRDEGRSEQEIKYYLANNQKDYEELLKDPDTPEKIITDIVDRITLVPLKILAFKHPNISARSQRYMLEKADKKKYQKDLIIAFLTSDVDLDLKNWIQIKKYYNTAKRTEKFVIEILNDQEDVSLQKLDVILNSIKDDKNLQTIGFNTVESVLHHKNFRPKILHGDFFTNNDVTSYNKIMEIIKTSPHQKDIMSTLYNITGKDEFLPQEAKDLFLF